MIYIRKNFLERSDWNFRKVWTRGATMSVEERRSGTATVRREGREFLGILLSIFRNIH